MADFISLHPEEWVALISGLRFSAAVAKAEYIFIPVIILVLGWSLFIWLYRLERDREWNAFILWLIFSSAIILSSFRTQNVVVELNPIVLNTKSMMLSIKQEDVKVDKQRQTLYVYTPTSGISALLAIPDKIASLMFNFMDANVLQKLVGQARTVPLDNMACRDPRYVAGLVQMVALDWALGTSMQKDERVEVFRERVRVFGQCYRQGFKGDVNTFLTDLKLDFNGRAVGEAAGRGLITVVKTSPLIGLLAFTPWGWGAVALGASAMFLVGAIGGPTLNLVKRMREDRLSVPCETFVDAFKRSAEQVVAACEELLNVKRKDEASNVKRKDEAKKVFVDAVLACLTNPDEIPETYPKARQQCLELREKTLAALDTANQAVKDKKNISKDSPLKGFLAGVVSEVKAWWFSLTYMDFPLKFDLLAKGQGIVLALLTGMFPFVAVLSVIPTGRSFMNWPLLLNFMIAYFLVKMWIPLLFFIVNVAGHNLARITGGF